MPKTYIVIHHSATPDGVIYRDFDAIKRGHLARGYRDIGYQYVVEYINGKLAVTKGRAEWDTGAHCIPRNKDSIGICIVGNFQGTVPTEELYQFVATLCKDIMTRHPIKEIGGHNQYDATACPGQYFNVEKVRQLTKGQEPTANDALDWLCQEGVIANPEYWKNAVGCVKYLDALLIGTMKKFKGV